MTTWTLIHSPLVGPTTWRPVAQELERRGRHAVVPSLAGVAVAAAPQWRHCVEAVRVAADGLSQLLLVSHSGSGALLPPIAEAASGGIAGLIFVDSSIPPSSGHAQLIPSALMQRLANLAIDGQLPPWSEWFGDEVMEELVPDAALRAALVAEMPRLPLSYFEASVPMPADWDELPCSYLLLSETYRQSADEARDRGWPVVELPRGNHLSLVTDPVAVTTALLQLEPIS